MRLAAISFVLAGFAAGAAAVQGLHAQTKPPTYVVIEIDVQEPDRYQKEFAGPAAVITGTPPRRAALIAFEDLDRARASFRTEAFKELRKTGQKHATFRVYALEGITP